MLLLKIFPFSTVWLVSPFVLNLSHWHIKSLISPNEKTFLMSHPPLVSTPLSCSLSHKYLELLVYRHYLYSLFWPYYSTKTVCIKATNDHLVASAFSASQQHSTVSYFLLPKTHYSLDLCDSTFSWILLFSVTTADLSSIQCLNWCALRHRPQPHLFSLCTFTWYRICSQNFIVLTPQCISPALISPLNVRLI